MRNSDLTPRVYVACLACYNAGKLHGEWFDVEDGLSDAVAEHFKADDSGKLACGGEELMCHDNEGFGPYKLGEVSVPEAEKIGAFLSEHGIPGALALSNFNGDIDAAESAVTDSYRGAWGSLADFAEDLSDQLGDKVPDHLAPYIDWERYSEALENGGDVWTAEHDGQVHVFWND